MSKATEAQKDKAARLAASTRRREDATTEPSAPAVRAERVKPVRTTLDLVPTLHAALEDWTTQANRQRGRGRVARSDVLRVLVRQLLDDEDLQRRVMAALAAETR